MQAVAERVDMEEAVAGRAAVTGDWQSVHAALSRLAGRRAELDFEEGCLLVAALRSGAHSHLGYGSFIEYIERLFGYSPRLTYEKLRVAEALDELAETTQALRTGKVSWSVARELTRVATPETESEWLDVAAGRTVREVERLVSGHPRGGRPHDPVVDGARRHVLRFEVSGEALAIFREALTQMRREAAGPLDDDAALLLMARQVLGGPTDDGRASYQVQLTVCEQCRRAQQLGGGEWVAVGPEVSGMAACDAQHVADTHVGNHAGIGARSTGESSAGASRKSGDSRSEPADTIGAKGTTRATQDVPPATRRFVLRRDGHRCGFPGCFHAAFVDVHHVNGRTGVDAHEPDNLITLCGAHHRALHRGQVTVAGRVGSGLRFYHSDGTTYGGAVQAERAGLRSRAFQALRKLGFAERDVRPTLERVCAHVGHDANLEAILRSALGDLTAGSFAPGCQRPT